MDQLRITLFGIPHMRRANGTIRGFVSSKAAALVYYLAVSGHAHSRETLAALLWPHVPDTQASKNLRDVLSNLRRLLDSHLAITRQTVALEGDTWLDVRHFEALLDSASRMPASEAIPMLREAVALYEGDFLEGFTIADAPAFEEWLLVEREHLRLVLLQALETLAEHAAASGNPRAGLADAARLLALDPLREAAHRLMMRLLATSGQRSAALAQYEACRRVLDQELGLDPDEETQALHKQILDGALGTAPPTALPSAVRPVYRVPALLTMLLGRATELAHVLAWLARPECRLISIVGLGGMGKTSLALEVAHQLLEKSRRGEQFLHGIAFVDVSVVEGANRQSPGSEAFAPLVAAVADALDLAFTSAYAPQTQLTNYLREKDMLLIFDTCEHVPHVGEFVAALLRAAQHLKIVATSRVRLGVRGEQVIALDGLSFPSGQAVSGEHTALQLFRRVALAANPNQPWSADDEAAAARICALLGGLPLGIELAASLTRLIPCAEIARELQENLALLDSDAHELPERHRSLRAVFNHSWRLLNAEEQRVLRQLSVFRGGWSREATHEVAGASVALLASLLDQSLVHRVVVPGQYHTARYDLLDLTQHYAAEQLVAASVDEAARTHERHARFYLDLLAHATADLRSARQQEALAVIHTDIENVRAAWRWAVSHQQLAWLDGAADALFYMYEMRSRFGEGSELFAQATHGLDERAGKVFGRLVARQGWLTFQAGRQNEGRTLLARSLEALETLGAHAETVFPLNYLAAATYYAGDYASAEQLAERALATSQQHGDEQGVAIAKTIFGQIAYLVGRYDDARRHSLESLAIERRLGNGWGMGFTLMSLGRVAQSLGEYETAQRYFQEGLHIRQAMHDIRGTALCLNDLGDVAEALGKHAEARWCFGESLALFREIGNSADMAAALIKLGYNALALKETTAYSHFLAALEAAWACQDIPRTLAALMGLANTLAEGNPTQACALATLVAEHAASTRASRDRAAALLAQLPSATPPAHYSNMPFEQLVIELLSRA